MRTPVSRWLYTPRGPNKRGELREDAGENVTSIWGVLSSCDVIVCRTWLEAALAYASGTDVVAADDGVPEEWMSVLKMLERDRHELTAGLLRVLKAAAELTRECLSSP